MTPEKQLRVEIEAQLDAINTLKHEPIMLPADIVIGHSTNRPELFSLVKRNMGQDEVASILDALGGEMRLRTMYTRLADLYEELLTEVGPDGRS